MPSGLPNCAATTCTPPPTPTGSLLSLRTDCTWIQRVWNAGWSNGRTVLTLAMLSAIASIHTRFAYRPEDAVLKTGNKLIFSPARNLREARAAHAPHDRSLRAPRG